MTSTYITIGNSDDKLTQAEWSAMRQEADDLIRRASSQVFGAWVSPSADPWQNACWCVEVDDEAAWLRGRLQNLALAYHQDSIAWAVATNVEFLAGVSA